VRAKGASVLPTYIEPNCVALHDDGEARKGAEKTHLVGKNALNTLNARRLVLLVEVLERVGDLPVTRSSLDRTESDLTGLVSGLEEVSTEAGDGLGADDDTARSRSSSVHT
jgi:hypothetical protein